MPLKIKPTGIKLRPISPTIERLATHFVIQENGCWDWTGYKGVNGYGQVTVDGVSKFAHRVMYELVNKQVDLSKQLDHLCRNRACISPKHLEEVDARTNTRRGQSLAAENHRKTHCVNGHPLSGDNLILKHRPIHGGVIMRMCKACQRNYNLAYWHRHGYKLDVARKALQSQLEGAAHD